MAFDLDAFRAASEAAEQWAAHIREAHHYSAERNEPMVAYGLLLAVWYEAEYSGHPAVIQAALEELAAHSDGIVRVHGLGGLQCFASAHAAILDTRLMLYLFVLLPASSITDKNEREALVRDRLLRGRALLTLDTSELRARAQRERAKLIQARSAQVPPAPREPEWSTPDTLTAWARVFRLKPPALKARLRSGAVRSKHVSSRRIMLALNDIPAGHREKYRLGARCPTSDKAR